MPGVHCRKRRVRRVFFSGFVATVPLTLEEAATIDGAAFLLPSGGSWVSLLKPPMVTLLIIVILRVWNDFYVPADPFAGQDSLRTLPLTIYLFKGDYLTQWNVDDWRHDPGDPAADDRVFHLSKTDHFRNAERIGKTIGASGGTTMTE